VSPSDAELMAFLIASLPGVTGMVEALAAPARTMVNSKINPENKKKLK
jgi:hypothetical protein